MSGCADVCIDMDVCDGNDFYTEALIKRSRKARKCCECRETIPVGVGYQRASGKTDGSVWSAVTCLDCAEIRKVFCCGGWIFGELQQSMEEQMFDVWREYGPFDCLAKIETLSARNKLRAWYDDWAKN